MGKKERIQVQLSAATLIAARAKTKMTGESLSGYIRSLIMIDLHRSGDYGFDMATKMLHEDVGNTEKKSDPTGSMEDAGFAPGVLLEGEDREQALDEMQSNTTDAIEYVLKAPTEDSLLVKKIKSQPIWDGNLKRRNKLKDKS